MDPKLIFVVGMVGAMAPEIVRLYGLRKSAPRSPTGFYIVISLAFAALGGFVALILPATTLLAAFYAGISTPVLVSTALKKGMTQEHDNLRGPDTRPAAATPSFATFVRAL